MFVIIFKKEKFRMSDSENDAEEALIQKHKKEKKELQAQIQKLKHSAPKGDKKKKKEVTEEIARLESELSLDGLKTSDEPQDDTPTSQTEGSLKKQDGKISRTQKRRDKKAAKEKEREQRIIEQEKDNLTGDRNVEFEKMKAVLKSRGLQIYEIPSDGNCLYNAINHQLKTAGINSSCESLRKQTAQYLRDHAEDFFPFMTKDNGDLYTEEDFVKYCQDVESTTAWGGQIEIQAMSHVLKQPMEVIQSDIQPIKIGEQYEKGGQSSIILPYHKHAYGLGEHYNSVEPYKEEEEDGFI
ncbi:hypothetical protein KUTeg_005959 [Tegillarca granosa]|uniref:OTU domain-containing protein n=1 Tax=Tegillarca granosa TaxID=220873 RepID=A0ABQ9FJT7_TEGGR|nr:hypothetical protein KUTeg_005959 [Tegillarca granosa]